VLRKLSSTLRLITLIAAARATPTATPQIMRLVRPQLACSCRRLT